LASNQAVPWLTGNLVAGNMASAEDEGYGGGVAVIEGEVTLTGNTVRENDASPKEAGKGGGVWVENSQSLAVTNNIIAGNYASDEGSGLWLGGSSSARFLHNTIADNRGSGDGLYGDVGVPITCTNTIVSGHAGAGIVSHGSAQLVTTLWHNNGARTGGSGYIVRFDDHTGDPAFVSPHEGDYHIGPTSAAIDAGVDAGVTTDIDGHMRPVGGGYDIGADEAGSFSSFHLYVPAARKS
jgi:fibronectin-binding autotransporter adhesin